VSRAYCVGYDPAKHATALYKSLEQHKKALEAYKRLHEKAKKREETLKTILSTLREGYNPNYQDMAVLEAVRGWEAFDGLHPKGSDADLAGERVEKTEEPENLNEGDWTDSELEDGLSDLIDTDHMSLLLAHEGYIESNNGTSPSKYLSPVFGQSKLTSD
jgi:protein kinase C substrate 80K-H